MYFASYSSRARCFAAVAIIVTTTHAKITDLGYKGDMNKSQALETKSASGHSIGHSGTTVEETSIHEIDIPFLIDEVEWGRPGKGILMGSYGEPKSGTTWTERVITELAVQLCGSSTNTWCQMGGLKIYPNRPAPSYEWEMLYADKGKLFLHFDGKIKHTIPGLQIGKDCNNRGRPHANSFELRHPCRHDIENTTRESLLKCIPDTSDRCSQRMPSRNPSVLRMAVVFRDPRDIVISERRMRIEVYKRTNTADLVPFIYQRFNRIVSWQFMRWVWHTTFYKSVSHVMFYEDIQSNPVALAGLANFIGLNCSLNQVQHVQDMHLNRYPSRSFAEYELPATTLKYMNDTMSRLLPEEMAARYGLSPTLP